MPAYNFKEQFADAVEGGEKGQTIRKKRKRPTKPGDTIYLYTGMRTKKCRKLGEGICTSVEDIEIRKESLLINWFYFHHQHPKVVGLVTDDGFYTWDSFVWFFEVTYGLPFKGEIIKWRGTR